MFRKLYSASVFRKECDTRTERLSVGPRLAAGPMHTLLLSYLKTEAESNFRNVTLWFYSFTIQKNNFTY
jgi:hypothetical protein